MAVISGRISSRTDSGLDIACAAPATSPSASYIRGACPSLEAPMMTGDGLLVRLRPENPTLHIEQFTQLASAAARHGNGLIEVTARGSLQLRGLRDDTLSELASDIAAAGIVPETGVVIETSPLASLDPTEIGDATAIAKSLRLAMAAMMPKPKLAPKLSIIVDGAGRVGLDSVPADIRLMAARCDGGKAYWRIALAGDGRTARGLAVLPGDTLISAVITILEELSAIGPRARARDLDIDRLRSLFATDEAAGLEPATQQISAIGVHDLGQGAAALGVGLPYAQIQSSFLIAFLDRIKELGISELRLAPGHGLLLLGIRPDMLDAAKLAAANFALLATPDDPRNQIHTCAGSVGCASAFYDTKALAAEIVGSLDLFDGSIDLHLSGCSKGCAHPGRAALTLTGTPMGYGLVVNGSASGEPAAYIQREELTSALAALKRLVDQHKGAGESIDACLKRFGKDEIAKALDRDRNA